MNPWTIDSLELLLRMSLAVLLGGLIGFEREKSNQDAGFRTHILVCLGANLIMLLSMYGFSAFAEQPNVRMDPARLAAQVVSGIGFLGAGVILTNGITIKGLTTAASLWVVAAIGLAVGAGFYLAASFATLLSLFSLLVLNKVERKWLHPSKSSVLHIQSILGEEHQLEDIHRMMESHDIGVIDCGMKIEKKQKVPSEKQVVNYWFNIQGKNTSMMKLLDQLKNLGGIVEIRTDELYED
ncbi:MgtC/SapB family protein [Marinicrinis sediminis]|uniref:MgtC/SapB family protein n=1 Tax=Marinicrinis sediminis TaxID=1652465 RepID=A0ABW5RCH0_9BACL